MFQGYKTIFDKDASGMTQKEKQLLQRDKYQILRQLGVQDEKNAFYEEPETTYHVDFRIQKSGLEDGQTLCILGELPELGQWKKAIFKMKRTADDYWVPEKPLVTNRYFFCYKYAVHHPGSQQQDGSDFFYEIGIDRIVDAEILPQQHNSNPRSFYEVGSGQTMQSAAIREKMKRVVLNDIWQKFKIFFAINYSTNDGTTQLCLQENSKQIDDNQALVQEREASSEWMYTKFGKPVRPYICDVLLDNYANNSDGVFVKNADTMLKYRYGRRDVHSTDHIHYEREPWRWVDVQEPHRYRGQLGQRGAPWFQNTNKVWIVNSAIHKAGGNFMGDFFVVPVGMDTKVFQGNHPTSEADIQKIYEHGCTAVLDLQTQHDHEARHQDVNMQKQWYGKRGINSYTNQVVSDLDTDQYQGQLFKASKVLNMLINKQGHKVFVNCTTGCSRATTLLIVYFAMFCRHPDWNNIQSLEQLVTSANPRGSPNMLAVMQILNDNKAYRQEQLALREKEERERAGLLSDKERQARLDAIKRELAQASKKRQFEEDADKQRHQHFKVDQNNRQKRNGNKLVDYENEWKRKYNNELARIEALRASELDNEAARRKAFEEEMAKKYDELQRLLKQIMDLEERIRQLTAKAQQEVDQENVDRLKEEQDEIARQNTLRIARQEASKISRQRQKIQEEEISNYKQFESNEVEFLLRLIKEANEKREKLEHLQMEFNSLEKKWLSKRIDLNEKENFRCDRLDEEETNFINNRLQSIQEQKVQRTTTLSINQFEAKSEANRQLRYEFDIFNSTYTPEVDGSAIMMNETQDPNDTFHEIQNIRDELFEISDNELDHQCKEIFLTKPIPFKCRKYNQVDQQIDSICTKYGINLPIVPIKANQYLVGPKRVRCELKQGMLMCSIGQGQLELFENFLIKNQKNLERALVVVMLKTRESLEQVIENMVQSRSTLNHTLKASRIVKETSGTRLSLTKYQRSAVGMGESGFDQSDIM